MKSLAWLFGGTLLICIAVMSPSCFGQDELAVFQCTVACAVSLVPALGTMAWALRAGNTPEQQLVAVLGGTVVRSGAVLASGFLLRAVLPEWFTQSFWIWLGFFYLVTLALETTLVLRAKGRATQ